MRQNEKAQAEEERILAAMRRVRRPNEQTGHCIPKGEFMGLRGKAKRELWDRRNE